ncbi:MAG TPA: GMC family oxidoreductase [Solirubrobacterales bacterium]|nr:GMC family oxidoreductase [Solirubrobacterales bacterium]
MVGSGFGGSVMAYRLAESGFDVCLLERGKAYPPGSFPRSPREMRGNFWDPSEDLHGLFDVWSFRGLEAIVSSGLGGGSLIYANVLLRKDPKWFVTEDLERGGYENWPVTRADLDPHYDRVEAMMKPQRYPVADPPYDATPKTRAFRKAAEGLGLEVQHPPLAVTFANNGRPPVPGEEIEEAQPNLHGAKRYTCRLVGECDVGCNWGAKNTLDYTYLSAAKRHGAELRTRAEVRSFAPAPGGGFRVGYVVHPGREEHTATADRLVLSAGTLGSTFLLLRNRDAFPGLSDRLGTRFCGNGDVLTFAVGCREVTEPARGPVITSAIRYPDELDGAEGRGFYIQDAGAPEFSNWLVQATDAPGSLHRAVTVLWQVLRQRLLGNPESNLSAEVAGILGDGELSARYLPLLGMGRDIPDGNMSLTKRGYLDIDWRTRKSGPYFERVRAESRRLAEALGAEKVVDNPIWHLRRVITVHPLGGCPMGRSDAEGVVDPYGQVWGYPGLFVADGSVMPGPVGPNPSLTIAALADRFADAIVESGEKRRPAREPSAVPARPGQPDERARAAVSFTEEMKGFVAFGETDYEEGFRAGRESGTALMFHLTITADDIDAFIADPEREARAEGFVRCEALGGERPVEGGVFNLFVDHGADRRRKRMLYRLPFADGSGRPFTLTGFKVVEDDPGFDVWRDTTTLYTRVLRGHVAPTQDERAERVAAGIIHIHGLDFAKQLTTFRSDPPGRLDALRRFGTLFAGDLWKVYGPGAR